MNWIIKRSFLFGVNSFLLVLLFPTFSYAWDPTGHKIVAAIAYAHLTSVAKAEIDRITEAGDPGYPALTRFLYAAPLPDIWRNNNSVNSSWHFYNEPWSIDGTPGLPAADSNFVTALFHNVAILNNPTADFNQKYVALAWVEHLVADAHQPLHCINRFSKDFPQGDMGGNLFLIKGSDGLNLHSYWDQIVHEFNPNVPYPLNKAKRIHLENELQAQYPIMSFGNKINDLNFNNWEKDCYQLAKANVYKGISPNDQLSTEYRASAKEIAKSQVTLAGYRLAKLLNTVFSN
ncbi:MAG: S1/P1 nuclease [Proteobacteria bacterium]|nr:S1/P1 nuclease [Pseudomonadota bacterium]